MGFKSWYSYNDFSCEVSHDSRYIYSEDVEDFLANVLETGRSRVSPVESGQSFWRAQLGCDSVRMPVGDEDLKECMPFLSERMTPRPYEASEGRVNPKGIPCLYLASNKETAMAEVRPWLDSEISLGKFKTKKELRLVNCSGLPFHGDAIYQIDPDEWKKEEAVWAAIDRAFSRPVTPNDKSSDYVPTQIIADLFRSNGYDGVFYKSALSDGLNVALFDIAAATMMNSYLCRVEKIRFSFGPLVTDDVL